MDSGLVILLADNLMLYILPEKDVYKRAKYETTDEIFVASPAFDQGGRVIAGALLSSVVRQRGDRQQQQQQQQPDGLLHPLTSDDGAVDNVEMEQTEPLGVPTNDLDEPLLRNNSDSNP